jgi:LysM repeat protein
MGLLSLGMAVSIAMLSFGCGRRLVDPGSTQPMQPTVIQPTPAKSLNNSGFGELPHIPADQVLPSRGQQPAQYHKVIKGETLTSIAKQRGTTVDRLLEANGLERSSIIKPGQLLFVPAFP